MKYARIFFFFLLLCSFVEIKGYSQDTPPAKIKIYFIINPIAGTKSKNNLADLISEHIDHARFDFEIVYTKGPGDATALSKKAALLGAACVVAVGGDGTVNEVARGLLHTDTALGIIPMGSGNGLANHLHLPDDPVNALETIQKQKTAWIDTVAINDDIFFGTAGVGFDAHIAHMFAKKKTRGVASYLTLILQEYSSYEPKEVELIVDGVKIRKQALVITFANSSQYGNDILIAPKAKIDDGYLDLVIIDAFPSGALLDVSRRILSGTINHSKYYHVLRCTEICIYEPHIKAHVDGEPRFFDNGIRIKLIPASLKVVR